MKKTINISGMHCVSCESLIEKELSKIKGIKKYKVSYKKNIVEVEGKKNAFKKVKRAIQDCGFKVTRKKLKSNKFRLSNVEIRLQMRLP